MRGCAINGVLWLASVAFLYFTGWSLRESGRNGFGSLLFIFYVVLIGPALGLLSARDVVSYLNWRTKKGAFNVLWRIFIGFWMILFAVVSVAFGCLLFMAGVQHLLKQDGPGNAVLDIVFLVMAAVFGSLLIGTGIHFAKWTFRKKEGSTEADEVAAAGETKASWEHLDFTTLERHLNCKLPAAYKAMMQPGSEWREQAHTLYPKGINEDDEDEYEDAGVERYTILHLFPPSPKALRQHPTTSEPMLCFAAAYGAEYWLRPGTDDPPVYERLLDDRATGVRKIAPRLSVFLSWPRREW